SIYDKLLSICIESSKGSSDVEQQMLGDLFTTGMDSLATEKNGIQPLATLIASINKIKTVNDALIVNSDFNKLGLTSLFDQYVAQDSKKSDVMACYLFQGGLGMPNRDYYFNRDKRTTDIRMLYPDHIAKMFMLLGQDAISAKTNANKVMQFETALADKSRKLEDLRDPYANYNKMDMASITKKLTPLIDWKSWFLSIGVKSLDSVIIGQPEFFKNLNALLKKTPIEDIKAYLTWQLIHQTSNYLGNAFDKENFAFYGTIMQGTMVQRPRWKRVIDIVEKLMGESMGKLFVQEYFPPDTKKRYVDIVNAVMQSYKEHIENLDWMSPETKAKSLEKLSKVSKKIGYPEKWKDFRAMKIDRNSYVSNVLSASSWWQKYNLNKLGKPVDRTEWDMTPQTYNAYYNPSNNEIVLPAGIFMIPGVKDSEVDDAVIYGYAGASTIGHEITHGFDDEGRQFDALGNLRDWWTKEDAVKFNKKVKGIVEQFNAYVPIDSTHINGKATAGENIADLGGVVIALDAFKKTEQYKTGKKISGLTPTQRFFLGYALGWLGQPRKEKLAQQLLVDVHAPGKYRVIGPLSNVPDFYTAFNIQPNQKMFRTEEKRVKIW
ncbi:MAG TPA: M13 family metallopeptidase, partial [Saprospiraceae bacterium]|nr:M13 family metallopeptidase [Saprospiraceae bacterium]